jgi:hypothetical protein
MKSNVSLKDLYLPVEKMPMGDLLPKYDHISGLLYAMVITLPSGEKRIVNYCSEDYHLVRNEEILPPLIEEVSRFYDIETNCIMRGYSRFYIDIILKNQELVMDKNDKVYAKIRVANSYDGSRKYNFAMGFWRQICKNGLMGFTNWDSVNRMHTPGLEELTNFSKVMEMVSLFLAEAEDHFDKYRELHGQSVRNPLLRIEEIAEETDFPVSMVEEVTARLEEEKKTLNTSEVTDWLIYNAFNYQLNHNEEYKAKEERKAKIDSQVFNYLLSY